MRNSCPGFSPEESSLVQRIAREIYYKYCADSKGNMLSLEDLCHFGIIGLLEARTSFDVSIGAPWLAFASIRVRGAMIDHLRKQPMIRLPQAVQQKVRELKEVGQLFQNTGQEQSPERLAEELGWTVETVNEMATLSPTLVPLDDGGTQDDEDGYQGEILHSEEIDPERQTLQSELAELVNKCLQKLNPQNRLVIVGRLLEGLKLRELATSLGCTMENIRIKQKKAETQLKTCIETHGWPVDSLDDLIGG